MPSLLGHSRKKICEDADWLKCSTLKLQTVFVRGGRENKTLFTHERRKLDLESTGKRYIGTYNVILLSLFRQQALLGSSSQSLKE